MARHDQHMPHGVGEYRVSIKLPDANRATLSRPSRRMAIMVRVPPSGFVLSVQYLWRVCFVVCDVFGLLRFETVGGPVVGCSR